MTLLPSWHSGKEQDLDVEDGIAAEPIRVSNTRVVAVDSDGRKTGTGSNPLCCSFVAFVRAVLPAVAKVGPPIDATDKGARSGAHAIEASESSLSCRYYRSVACTFRLRD
jgi:hypothetical protein